MQLCKVQVAGEVRAGALEAGLVRFLSRSLSDVLHSDRPADAARAALGGETRPLAEVTLLAAVDQQEVWAAGVTYKRSRAARERESVGAAQVYDLVYKAERPE